MGVSASKRWVGAALFVGLIYFVAGLTVSALAGAATSHQMVVTWRLVGWLASAVAFAAHIGYEQFRSRHAPAATALHASLAVALGACALAVAATLRAVVTETGSPRLLTLAIVVWPAMAGVPAFLVALAVASVLARRRRPG